MLVSLFAVHAQVTIISHDQVQPFAQPKPISAADKAAVKFKPQLTVSYGCKPYPAVDANGSISDGLKWSDGPSRGCTGSPFGSQVYSRSERYKDKWAIMYAWYFPKSLESTLRRVYGRRHSWQWVIVWIDDLEIDNAVVQGVSMSAILGFNKRSPPKEKYVDGSSVKLKLYANIWPLMRTALRLTEDAGETQDLIQWHQLTDAARKALSTFDYVGSDVDLDRLHMPLKDGLFTKTLRRSYPF